MIQTILDFRHYKSDEYERNFIRIFSSSDEPDVEEDDKPTSNNVVVGQMSIARDHFELYRHLTDKFGEIVPENLPAYKVKPTNAALEGLLTMVNDMFHATWKDICHEKVQEWKETLVFYDRVGLCVGWLRDHLGCCGDLLAGHSRLALEAEELEEKIQEKRNELEVMSKEARTVEMELEELTEVLKVELFQDYQD